MKYFILTIVIFLMACAASKETVKEEMPLEKTTSYDESFDPLSLDDDDIFIEDESDDTKELKSSMDEEKQQDKTYYQEINGYRVQILATDNIETASLVEQEATDRFERSGHKTYLIFEAPLYKIRVGDCGERSKAEELRDLAISYGYNGAFIVKTKVLTLE